jgi:hypothetical protein
MDKAYSLPLAAAPEHASCATFGRFYISRPRGSDQSVVIPGHIELVACDLFDVNPE